VERILAIILIVLFFSATTFSTTIVAETLEETWQIASKVNHQLRAQQHQVAAARAEVHAAQAVRNPSLSNHTAYITLSETPAFSIDLPQLPPQIPIQLPSSLNLPLTDQSFGISTTTLSMPLYTGGKISSAIDARRYQLQATQAGYSVSVQDLKLNVTESYLNVLRTRQLLHVAESAERSLFRHRSDIEKLLEQKIVTRNAMLAAEAAWASAKQDVIKANNFVLVAEAAFNRYLGRSLDSLVLIDEIPIPPISGELPVLIGDAMRYRKELTQINAQSRASAAQSKISHADRLPQVVALAGHSYVQNSHSSQESLWSGSIGLNWKPIDGGVSRARERVAIENAAAAARMKEETRSLIELQVRTMWISEQESRNRIEVAELGKRQANENLRVVTRQFQEGLINHTEVLDAQTLQMSAATNFCNATYDAILAAYRLKHAIGLLY
jgi:outer membrane protein TolC